MTYREDFTLPAELLDRVQEQGLDVLPELIRVIINTAMQAERTEHLKAAPYQHTPERNGYANGFKPKTMRTRVGEITFAVPQVREGGFYPQALGKRICGVNEPDSGAGRNVRTRRFNPQGESDHRTIMRCECLVDHKSVVQPPRWTVNWRNGENDHWTNIRTCFWMRITSRFERMDRYAIWQFWWLIAVDSH